jgi:hypothetical protein
MNGAVSPLLRTGVVRQSEDMANAMTTKAPVGDRFRVVQLLPAPVTLVALAVAASHDLHAAPLGAIAVVGVLATLGSTLIPALTPTLARAMPAPREEDRVVD